MTIEQVSKPVALAVSLASAKDTLRIEQADTAMDGQIEIYIRGIAAEAEHATGLCFINRPMQVTLDEFPEAIRLASPTVSVESVRYVDADGATQTLDPADYFVDRKTKPGYVVPNRFKAWPATAVQVGAVTVDFTAGYGQTADAVPEAAQLYIHARLAELFDPAAREFKETAASAFVGRLLDSIRVYG